MPIVDYVEALEEQRAMITSDCLNFAKNNSKILQIDFAVTTQHLNTIQNYFPGRIVLNSGRNYENSHPVHAFLTRFCYNDILEEIKGFDNVVEVGSSFTRGVSGVRHNCVLVHDIRTLSRYTQQSINLIRSDIILAEDLFNACSDKATTICHEGTENCLYKADVGFAIHATYDIRLETIATMMINHGFKIFYAYMYLPLSLLDHRLTQLINAHYGFDLSFKGNSVYFALGDKSFVYEHAHDIWLSYLETTKIDIEDKNSKLKYTITLEIDREWGPLSRIKMVLTKFAPGELTRVLPNYSFLNQISGLPNISKYIYSENDDLADVLFLPTLLTIKSLNYIARMPDENVKYSNFEAYFNAQCTEVNFEGNIIWHGWRASSAEQQRDITLSLFCIGASNRYDRSKVIGKFLRQLSNAPWRQRTGQSQATRKIRTVLFGNIHSFQRRLLSYITCGCVNWYSPKALIKGLARFDDNTILSNLHPQPLRDVFVNKTIICSQTVPEYKIYSIKPPQQDNKCLSKDVTLLCKNSNTNLQDSPTTGISDCGTISRQTTISSTDDNLIKAVVLETLNDIVYTIVENENKEAKHDVYTDSDKHQEEALTHYSQIKDMVDKQTEQYRGMSDVDTICQDLKTTYGDKIIIQKNNHKCKIYYWPPGDGYCGRTSLGKYVKNDLKPWCDYVTLINEATKHAPILFHFHDKESYYTAYLPVQQNVSKLMGTIIIALSTTHQHYYLPKCTCGGGLVVPVCYDAKDYAIDTHYFKQLEKSYKRKTNSGRVANKIKDVIPSFDEKIYELSAAPGYFAKYCDVNRIQYHGYIYNGNNAIKSEYTPKSHTIYNNLKNIKPIKGFILSDIGDEKQLADTVDDVLRIIGDNNCAIKVFLNDKVTTQKIAKYLNIFKMIKPTDSNALNSECYFVRHIKYNDLDTKPTSVMFDYYMNNLHPRNIEYHHDIIQCKMRNIENYRHTLTNSKIHKNIAKNTKTEDVDIHVEYTTGVAGCGKTRGIELGPHDAYVTPLTKLKNKYNRQHFTYEIFLNNLLDGLTYNTVYVDEAYMIPKGWYGMASLTNGVTTFVLIGDPYQIQLTDFNNTYDVDDIVCFGQGWDNNKSLRFGNTTAKLLNHMLKNKIPEIEGNGKEDKVTLKILSNDDCLYEYEKEYKVLHFHQKDKDLFKESNTIHEAQGSTYPKVLLYIDGAELDNHYIKDFRYTYVGMSRHQDELLILAKSQTSARRFISVYDSIMDVNMTKGVTPVSDVLRKVDVNRVTQPLKEDLVDTDVNDLASIEEILNKAGYIPNDSNVVTYMDAKMPLIPAKNDWGDKAKGRMRVRNFDTKPTVLEGFRPSTHNYVRHYAPQNNVQTLHTMIERYMRVAQRKSFKKFTPYFNMCNRLHRGLLKFTSLNSKEYYEFMTPTVNDLQMHMAEYIESVQDKISPKTMIELNTLNDDIKMSIDFFMKKQPKYFAKGVDTRLSKTMLQHFGASSIFGIVFGVNDRISTTQKAGQGVSAWPKRFNLIFAAYTRHMMHKLIELPPAKDSALIIGVGKSDAEIGAAIGDALSKGLNVNAFKGDDTFIKWMKKYLTTDFTQHDTSHSMVVRMWDCYDMLQMGFHPRIIAEYWHAYCHWRQTTNGDCMITIDNLFMQHSGSPNTIHGNTKLTMGANGACYEFCKDGTIKRLKIQDITAVDCPGFNKLNEDLQDVFGFRLKEDYSNPGEFICNIVTVMGFFPDVVRRTARYISKIYLDKDDFELTRNNVKDAVSSVLTPEAYNHGVLATTKYYNNHGIMISSGDVEILYNYLKNDKLVYRNNKQLYYIETLNSNDKPF